MSGQSTLSVSFGHMRVISFSFGDTRVKMQGSSNFAVLDINPPPPYKNTQSK